MTTDSSASPAHHWPAEFRVLSAWAVACMTSFQQFQILDKEDVWLTNDDQPIALLFVSHRWDSTVHPDPSGQQLRTLQTLVKRICVVTRALFANREGRLALVPDVDKEGTLQAEELVRRMLGQGPFAGEKAAWIKSRNRIRENVHALDAESFDRWMLGKIGLWVDFSCVPQGHRTASEQAMFEKVLGRLELLLTSSTVVALRRKNDDYSKRAWCVTEFWLSARRSFARSIFIDMDRVDNDLPIIAIASPSTLDASASVVVKSYQLDFDYFREAVAQWKIMNGPLDHLAPDAWGAYRSLQGSGFHTPTSDPNPARHAIDAMRAISTEVIQRWWMSDTTVAFNLSELVDQVMSQHELVSTEPADRTYLGLLLLSVGWIEALRPFFRASLQAYLNRRGSLKVELEPIAPSLRDVLRSVQPHSASVWFSRLSYQTGHRSEERSAIEALRAGLTVNPLRWRVDGAEV